MNRWDDFAATDPYFYVDTDFDRIRDEPDAIERFYNGGRATAGALLGEVAGLLPGRSLAIEIGCGVGRVLLGHVHNFAQLRAVDVSPRMLSRLEARASSTSVGNVQAFLPVAPWDEPPGGADYVYSVLVFQHIEAATVISDYITRIARVLRRDGIAQLQFDTRPARPLDRLRLLLPDPLLSRTQRRGIRRIRRDPEWVARQARDAGLEIVSERGQRSADHWFVLRRR